MPTYFSYFIKSLTFLIVVAFCERMVFMSFNQDMIRDAIPNDIWQSVYWGLRFDVSISASLALVGFFVSYIVERTLGGSFINTLRRMLYLTTLLLISLHGADLMYFIDSGRHLGYETQNWYSDGYSLVQTAVRLYLNIFSLHIAFSILAVIAIWWIFCTPDGRLIFTVRKGWKSQPEVQTVFIVLLSIVLIRGGFQSIPLAPLHAQEIGNQQKATLALNGAYNALYFSFSRDQIYPVDIQIDAQIDTAAIFDKLYVSNTNATTSTTNFTPQNIVLIFLESWPASYIASYGFNKVVTPYFDELRQKSLTTFSMLAGGQRTTEGMFSTLCSTQNPLGQTVAQSYLQNYEYLCLPHLLRNKGYSTAFFQGSHKNTSGTGAFAQLLGFTQSYGKADIKDRQYKENSWGVHDPDLYRFALKKIRELTPPFFVGINTNSTHDRVLPAGVTPAFNAKTDQEKIFNVMNFADKSLKNFIESLQKEKDLANTIFILLADHTAHVHSSNFNMYAIPFLIYAPNIVEKRFLVRAASQRDIVPTVLDILGHRPIAQFTGKSLLRDDQGPYFADYYHNGILGWIEDDLLIEIPISNPGSLNCFDYRNDPLLKNKLTCDEKSMEMTLRALSFTKTMQRFLFSGELKKVNKPSNKQAESLI